VEKRRKCVRGIKEEMCPWKKGGNVSVELRRKCVRGIKEEMCPWN
jgi:NAD-dependent dihydropyrimidine dehydrogenase PreA subunit